MDDNHPALLIQHLPGRETVAAGVWVVRGSAHDPEGMAGATHLVEHLTLRRCGGRDRTSLATLVDRIGGDVDAWTGAELMGVSLTTTVDALGDGLELLVDAIATPSFDHEDVELERRVILAELELLNDDPAERVEESLLRSAWGDHPLACPVIGSAESVEAMGIADLERHHRELVRPGRLLVAVAGEVNGVRELPCLAGLDLGSAPSRRMAASLVSRAVSGTKTTPSASTCCMANAHAAPWLPVDAVTMPLSRSAALNERILFSAPRTLKEPVCCRFSHLKYTSTPVRWL